MRDFYGRECECAACNRDRREREMHDKEWLAALREWFKQQSAPKPEEPPAWRDERHRRKR